MAFLCDVETLGLESTSIVLSAAITYFDSEVIRDNLNKEDMINMYHDYVSSSCTVKFNVIDQKSMGRIVDPDTLKWWQKQSQIARHASLMPSDLDVDAASGLDTLRAYINKNSKPNENNLVLARGCLDPMVLESLARSAGVQPITPHYMWRDVRTLVDLLANTTKGYVDIKNFDHDVYATKHVPAHDCALDILQIMYHV